MTSTNSELDITTFSVVDVQPPAKPTGFAITSSKVSNEQTQLTFSWDRNVEPDFAFYRLYVREDDGNDVRVHVGPDTSFSAVFTNGRSVKARVEALDNWQNDSTDSTPLTVTVGPGVSAHQQPDVFRFYNTEKGVHFYTASAAERDSVMANLPQFKYEGNAFDAKLELANPPPRDQWVPVFRFFNNETGTHFYTASEGEKNNVIANLPQFSFEGTAYRAFKDDGGGYHHALHRFYNTQTGTHFYTISEVEKADIQVSLPQFRYEGVAYYVDLA